MTVVESAGYTPFEQLESRGNVGPWSDLYALAGTLIKAITFETPPKANDRIRNDPHMPLAKRPEYAGRYSASMLAALDRAFEVDEGSRWQNAGEWLAALKGISPVTMHPPKPERTDRPKRIETPPQDPTLPGRKVKPLPWMIAASVVLGLIALATTFSTKEPKSRTVTAVDEAAVQRELDKTKENANIRAKDTEERVARAEQERQALVAEAKAKEEADAKEAQKQRVARADQDRQEAKAKEDADAKAKRETLSVPGSKAGEEREFEIAPGVKIAMCWIPPGEFLMGSPESETGRSDDETQHRVTLTQGFWLAKMETTQAQWQTVMGNNPSAFIDGNLPVECVSWNDIAGPDGFISKVNQSATMGGIFSLPTEAQWEYACRAGRTGSYAENLDEMAWYSGSKTHPVGQKKANAWGLQDMHGNVWERCADWYGKYSSDAVTDPRESPAGSRRVLRGGGWRSDANDCRAAYRSIDFYPSDTNYYVGFRIARSSVP
jgi:formylglycine-generating enzyme required for sulfatase activity